MVIQFCGTGSGVGKSVITAAFCRIFLQDGLRPCPFKAQNMALNSYVTKEGGEIGRAQAVQAQAARLEPAVDMNPILMKPTSDRRAQIILKGKALKNMSVYQYVKYKKIARQAVIESFRRLKEEYEVVVIEGAGSPAEINLRSHDIVNLEMAKRAGAPVILVGDIDKGGVFAWLIGTLALLEEDERKMIKGFIINKFRGDKRLLLPGIRMLEKRTGIKVLGVVPYFKDIRIPEEDSVPLEKRAGLERKLPCGAGKKIEVAVISLPHISNFTDFDALENEPDVRLRYVEAGGELGRPDLVIIPGSKNTVFDLEYIRKKGMEDKIRRWFKDNPRFSLVGLCGGYQMLGERICDPRGAESAKKEISGMGFLPLVTEFGKSKVLSRSEGKEISSGLKVSGYEIHHGRSRVSGRCLPLFRISRRQDKKTRCFEGALSLDGRVWGTYLHGVFDADGFRRGFLNRLRARKGMAAVAASGFNYDREFDKLALLVRKNVDLKSLYGIMRKGL
ncbi:MAG: cobyric acid synthase [Candidatus Omnitrophota bacterium]